MHRTPAKPSSHYHRAAWNARPAASPALLLAGLLAVGAAGFYFGAELGKPVEAPVAPPPMLREEASAKPEPTASAVSGGEADPAFYYPVGEFVEDPARKAYVDESMELYIPKMDLMCPVYGATDDETLLLGPGLFENAMLPGPMTENANVSIAGNRDVGNSEFLLIDTLVDGDAVYLLYEGTLYTYEVTESFETVFQDYFEPIRVKEYPCVTLQSCTPPGEARETQDRIFVTAKLVGAEEEAGFPE